PRRFHRRGDRREHRRGGQPGELRVLLEGICLRSRRLSGEVTPAFTRPTTSRSVISDSISRRLHCFAAGIGVSSDKALFLHATKKIWLINTAHGNPRAFC